MISLEDLIARIKGMTPTTKVLKPKGYSILCEMGRAIQDAAPGLTEKERREVANLWEENVARVSDNSLSCIRVMRSRPMYKLTLKALKGDFPPSITPYYGSEGGSDDRTFVHPAGAATDIGPVSSALMQF